MSDRISALGQHAGQPANPPKSPLTVTYRGKDYPIALPSGRVLCRQLALFRKTLTDQVLADRASIPADVRAELGLDQDYRDRLQALNREFEKGELGLYGETGEAYQRWRATPAGQVAAMLAHFEPGNPGITEEEVFLLFTDPDVQAQLSAMTGMISPKGDSAPVSAAGGG